MEFKDMNKVHINKKLCYFLVFLALVIPAVVGVLVWYFMPKCDGQATGVHVTDPQTGDNIPQTTIPTTPFYSESEPWKNLRLPRFIRPVHYDISLYPDFYGDHGWFYGNESVEIAISRDTNFILIHFNYMNITRTTLADNRTGRPISIKRTFAYKPNQFWVVETDDTLTSGRTVKLQLQFDGSLTNAIVGFYKSTYINSITGQTRNLATSKFEPVDARRAFPCFDEPNIKAEYTITLIHDPTYVALSNMPPATPPIPIDWARDLVATRFQRSVKMSTYLVCFIVCDFAYIETTTTTGKKLRVYATPDKINQTQYALEVGKHTMEEYERLFQLQYPLPKQDMIAIPDFVSGAMEHWGLITYREVNLLYDPRKASSANKQRVAAVIAHEISHQWFGNIVTMDWWDDLWLNEGFASYMAYIGVDSLERDWEMMAQLNIQDQQPVMVTDAGVESHPIVVPVEKPEQINAVFDSISYSKGSSVIRMLESIMGKERFFRGVARYLKRYEWGNARTDDLWRALGEIDGAPDVKHIMDTWTRQMGFPVVDVTFTPATGRRTVVSAAQSRFLSDPNATYDANDSQFRYRWYVSLDYVSSASTDGVQTMDMTNVTFPVSLDMTDNSNWIKFNVNHTGFYRVNYPDNVWRRFATALYNSLPRDWKLTAADRSGLLDDAMALAASGHLKYDVALEMTRFLSRETNYVVWLTASRGLRYISDMFEFGGAYDIWREYVLRKVKPVLDYLGWDDRGSHLQRLMRVTLIDLACSHGDEDCIRNATTRFRYWLDRGFELPANLRSMVYKYGMRDGGTPEDWEKMWQKYLREPVPQERQNILRGLSRTRTLWLLSRYLEFAKDESKVRSQDFFTVLRYIADNSAARGLVWDWVRQNWEYLVQRFTLYSRSLGRLIPSVVNDFNTEFQLRQVLEFFRKYPDAGTGERGRKQAIETIKRNINWMKRSQATIVEWLQR